MKAMLGALCAALLITTSAHASAADDGNAGLEALNAGDYGRAVTLFTRAINSGELSPDDQEFALANRGRAYAKEGQTSQAIADLDHARRMRPDDADAQNDLGVLIAAQLPAQQIPGLPKASFWGQLGKAMVAGAAAGIAAGLAGDGQ